MAQNAGKKFEKNFKNSVPDDIYFHREKDSAQSFNQTETLRFTLKNPYDLIMYSFPVLFCLELKTVATSSISFARSKNEKGVIHYHQIEGLRDAGKHKGIIAGFVVNFRKNDGTENTYFIGIDEFDKLMADLDKKSFNEADLRNYNIISIAGTKKRVNYEYNIAGFVKQVKEINHLVMED